jgi:hypothetical protein
MANLKVYNLKEILWINFRKSIENLMISIRNWLMIIFHREEKSKKKQLRHKNRKNISIRLI